MEAGLLRQIEPNRREALAAMAGVALLVGADKSTPKLLAFPNVNNFSILNNIE